MITIQHIQKYEKLLWSSPTGYFTVSEWDIRELLKEIRVILEEIDKTKRENTFLKNTSIIL